jgi:hypothetical protein
VSYYQTIYNRLRAAGLTEAGALAMLGNFDCESNCEPNRLQGDFSPYRSASKQYVQDVTSGRIGRDQFANDKKGFGLYQLTFSTRKAGYYDFWRSSGNALDDAELQCDYAIKEMPSEAPGLLDELKTSNDLYQCVKDVCIRFERPAINNIDARFQSAMRIKNEIDLNPQPVPPEPPGPEPPVPPTPTETFWPPRTIDFHCIDWPEVTVLGAALYCRGYLDYAAGAWNDEVTDAVKEFQRDSDLVSDGCVGPATWSKLLSMGKE